MPTRYLSGRTVKVERRFYDDETALTPASVNVAIRADGATVDAASGAATGAGGLFTFTTPSALPEGVYTATWTCTGPAIVETSQFEVVGAFLFELPDLRASDPDISDTGRFPTANLKWAREVVESDFELITARSFVPRTATVTFTHDGSDDALLGILDTRSLKAISADGTALTPSDYTLDRFGGLSGLDGLSSGSVVTATVAYGWVTPPPGIYEAALTYARHVLTSRRKAIPDRATSFVAGEGGTFTMALPGRNGYETGLPDVDAALNRYSLRILRDVAGVY